MVARIGSIKTTQGDHAGLPLQTSLLRRKGIAERIRLLVTFALLVSNEDMLRVAKFAFNIVYTIGYTAAYALYAVCFAHSFISPFGDLELACPYKI